MEEVPNKRSGFPEFSSAPWLTFFHGKSNKMSQTFYSISKRRFYVRRIREMRNSGCWATVLGWILIHDLPSEQWFLLNPKTMEKIELPQLDCELDSFCHCILTSPPTDPDCVIMCTDFECNFLYFCRPGGDKWIKHGYDLGEDNLFFPIACNGKFYARTVQNSFVIIDFAPRPGIRILGMEQFIQDPIGLRIHLVHLVESVGQTFMIRSYFLGYDDKIIHHSVSQMNFSTNLWEKVESIGDDRVFILVHSGSAVSWSASELGVKGNCIYFTEFKDGDTRMCVFDMEEGTIAAHLPCPNVHKSCSVPLCIVPAP